MSKKDYSNCAVEFYLEKFSHSYREVYWRIDPEELSLWRQIFRNPWRKLYHKSGYRMSYLFNTKEYAEVRRLKTYNDVMKYIKEEESKAQKEHDEYVDRGVIWDDEPIYPNM